MTIVALTVVRPLNACDGREWRLTVSIKKRARPLPVVRHPSDDGRPKNRLLAALPTDDLRRVQPSLTTVPMSARQVLHRSGEPISFIYFPNGGIVSAATVLSDGTTLSVATIGNEGVIGGDAMLGGEAWSFADSVVRVPDTAERMGVDAFRRAVSEHAAFRNLTGGFLHVLIGQLLQNAICRVRHDARQRCARWLLAMHDRMYGHEFLLSHEALADMLGMQRPTVSAVASSLQRKGLIRYRYGRVTVLNPEGLEAETCECYASLRALLDRLRR